MPIQCLLIGVYDHLMLRKSKWIIVPLFYKLICEIFIGSTKNELDIFFEDISTNTLQMGIISEDTFTFWIHKHAECRRRTLFISGWIGGHSYIVHCKKNNANAI